MSNTIKKKVLILEKERTLLTAMKLALESAGYDVIIGPVEEKISKLVVQYEPDLIILGSNSMPDEYIKVPAVAILDSIQDISRVNKFGVQDSLVKDDFSPSLLLKKIKNIVGEASSKEEPLLDFDGEEKEAGSEEIKKPLPEKITVLVVEDDEFLRKVMSEKLLKEGFEVEATIDAASALESLKKIIPQVILLDLILPGMDGFELLTRLKKDPAYASIPVIVLSNLGQKEDKERAISLGAVDYLIKADFTPAEIIQRVRSVLG